MQHQDRVTTDHAGLFHEWITLPETIYESRKNLYTDKSDQRFLHLVMSLHYIHSMHHLNAKQPIPYIESSILLKELPNSLDKNKKSAMQLLNEIQSYASLMTILIRRNLDEFAHYQVFFTTIEDHYELPDILAKLLIEMHKAKRSINDERMIYCVEFALGCLEKLIAEKATILYIGSNIAKLVNILVILLLKAEKIEVIKKLFSDFKRIEAKRVVFKIYQTIDEENKGVVPDFFQLDEDLLSKSEDKEFSNVFVSLDEMEAGEITFIDCLQTLVASSHPTRFDHFQALLRKLKISAQVININIQELAEKMNGDDENKEILIQLLDILMSQYSELRNSQTNHEPPLEEFLQTIIKTAWITANSTLIEKIISLLSHVDSWDLLALFNEYAEAWINSSNQVDSAQNKNESEKMECIIIGVLFELTKRGTDLIYIESKLIALVNDINQFTDTNSKLFSLLAYDYKPQLEEKYNLEKGKFPNNLLSFIPADDAIAVFFKIGYSVFRFPSNVCTSSETREHDQHEVIPEMPITCLLKTILSTSDLKLYYQFYSHFKKINQRSELRYQRDFDYLIFDNEVKILNLYAILGKNTFAFLSGFIKTSVLEIERFFNSYEPITDTHFLSACLKKLGGLNHQQLESILLLISSYYKLNTYISQCPEFAPSALIFDESLLKLSEKELMQKISYEITRSYCAMLGLEINEKMDVVPVLLKLPLPLLAQLLVARNHMAGNNYGEVFDELLRIDLTPNASFKTFISDQEQASFIGRSLAIHNQLIIDELREEKINVELALNYPETKQFTFIGNSSYDFNQLLIAIWRDIEELNKTIGKLPQTKNMLNLTNKINNFIYQINKKQTGKVNINDIETLKQIQQNRQLIKDMIKTIERIKKYQSWDNEVNKNSFFEFAGHLIDHEKMMADKIHDNHNKIIKLTKPKSFLVHQWDKSKIETFFLGNYLSCCLATNSSQFHGMVQRRMDNAIQIHVITDEETGEPISGVWLFYAINQLTGKIVLVANYIEMRAALAQQPLLRDALVNELLEFTGEYARRVGAEAFYIRPLVYGLIPDFTHLKTVNVDLEKIGGYLEISYKDGIAQENYFLDAVSMKSLYQWESTLEKKESLDHAPLSSFVQLSIFNTNTIPTMSTPIVPPESLSP